MISAPIRVPNTPETYAITFGEVEGRIIDTTAATIGGINAGTVIPTPLVGLEKKGKAKER